MTQQEFVSEIDSLSKQAVATLLIAPEIVKTRYSDFKDPMFANVVTAVLNFLYTQQRWPLASEFGTMVTNAATLPTRPPWPDDPELADITSIEAIKNLPVERLKKFFSLAAGTFQPALGETCSLTKRFQDREKWLHDNDVHEIVQPEPELSEEQKNHLKALEPFEADRAEAQRWIDDVKVTDFRNIRVGTGNGQFAQRDKAKERLQQLLDGAVAKAKRKGLQFMVECGRDHVLTYLISKEFNKLTSNSISN